MPQELKDMSKEELLENVEKQEEVNEELRTTVAEQGKTVLEMSLKAEFGEHVDRGALTPANAEKYKKYVQDAELSGVVKEAMLMVLKDIVDNSQIDLSDPSSDPNANNDDADTNTEREAFIKKRVGELMADGQLENKALSIARKEWNEQSDDEDDE